MLYFEWILPLDAPAFNQNKAVSTSRIPPPTRQSASLTSFNINSLLEPFPRAASRSTTAISPATRNWRAIGTGSPNYKLILRPWVAMIKLQLSRLPASTFCWPASPPTSWTVVPFSKSIEGMIGIGCHKAMINKNNTSLCKSRNKYLLANKQNCHCSEKSHRLSVL